MSILEIFILSVGLCFDTFAVSLSSGICLPYISRAQFAKIFLSFALFQSVFTFTGWVLGKSLLGIIGPVDHWIAFLLLAYIGVKMIREGLENNEEEVCIDVRKTKILITVSVATSIDALAVGIGLAMAKFTFDRILITAAIIFVVTAIAASAGLKGGRYIGTKAGRRSEIFGGLILIAIGLKILVEHLEILS
jgi:putative Mn2+ efflux pump MntP